MNQHGTGTPGLAEGTILWQPSAERKKQSNLNRYMRWLGKERNLRFRSYKALWDWSVRDSAAFWGSIWDYFAVRAHRPYTRVLGDNRMPGAEWFPGAELNYAEHALARRDDHPAVVFQSESVGMTTLSYAELYRQTASVSAALKHLGVGRGDRVVAYMPNIPETLIAFLATASLGAIWSSCSPDFGTRSVVDRLQQIEPKVLFAVDGYRYNGRAFDCLPAVAELQRQLPTLQSTVMVPYLSQSPDVSGLLQAIAWGDLLGDATEMEFVPVPFNHPLYVLYSSGTTGLPKPIVHGHGGILLEHLKSLSLHLDLGPQDRFFWFTTTGWTMWNILISGLVLGGTVVMYDGSPGYPDMGALWHFAEAVGITYFGVSAGYLMACAKAGVQPGRECKLDRLRGIGSTGSPLTPDGFAWVYESVKADVHLGSFSGGTDVCTGFVGPCPLLPVRVGEIQCRTLGSRIEAFDDMGRGVTGTVGELVITAPMPSMPLYFWNDPGTKRYLESYFETYPGVWRHGDWIRFTHRGSCVISGRSDSTLNRGGVRMGTSEFYGIVEGLPEVLDSLVADTGQMGRDGKLLLFLVLQEGMSLDATLTEAIRTRLRKDLSPRHVPDAIYQVAEVPRTINGKKLEIPIKRILLGAPAEKVLNPGTVSNPASILFFTELAGTL